MIAYDKALFQLINQQWANAAFDGFMPWITDFSNTAPFLALVVLWALFGAGGKYRGFVVFLALSIGLSDTVCSRVIKPIAARKRPCCEEPGVRKLIPCKSSKSFPSSHAANTAMAAGVFLFEKGLTAGLPVLAISAIVGYSRIYVGVHYPLDVAVGFFLGLLLSFLATRVRRRFFPRLIPPEPPLTAVQTPAPTATQKASAPSSPG